MRNRKSARGEKMKRDREKKKKMYFQECNFLLQRAYVVFFCTGDSGFYHSFAAHYYGIYEKAVLHISG